MTVVSAGFGDATLVASVGGGLLGSVRVVIPGAELPSGSPWELRALSTGVEYVVRGGSGVGSGEQVVLVDAAAPLNTTTTYQLYVDGTPTAYVDVVRAYSGRHAIVSVDGGVVADFGWTARGGDARSGGRRFHASVVPGRSRPPLRLDPVAGAGGGSLEAETEGESTTALRTILASNGPAYLFHNEGICRIPGCDIPQVELVYFTSDGNDRTGHIDRAVRAWGLSYILVDDPEPDFRVTLSTWDDVDDAGLTWAQMDALGLDWDAYDRTDWSQVGA